MKGEQKGPWKWVKYNKLDEMTKLGYGCLSKAIFPENLRFS